jgi:hypothetical protein
MAGKLTAHSQIKRDLDNLEAATGFEPVRNGFADRRLTTWLCRLKKMEREAGIEPVTLALARRCSTTELLPLVRDIMQYRDFEDLVNFSTAPVKNRGSLKVDPEC